MPNRRSLEAALALLALLAALAFLAGFGEGRPGVRMATKAVPALALAALVVARSRDAYAGLVAAGLLASAVGDALLEQDGAFLQGLAAFLLGHLLYTAAFVSDVRRAAWPRLLPFAAWGGVAWPLLRPGLGGLAWPVAAYLAAILTMMWRAAARWGASPRGRASAWWAAAGAVLFGLSDTLLALDRFHGAIPGVRLPLLLLYWAGQIGIAQSARLDASREVS